MRWPPDARATPCRRPPDAIPPSAGGCRMRYPWNLSRCGGCTALSRAPKRVALPRRWVVAHFRPRCPPRTVYVCLGEWRLPRSSQVCAGVCRMRGQLPAGGLGGPAAFGAPPRARVGPRRAVAGTPTPRGPCRPAAHHDREGPGPARRPTARSCGSLTSGNRMQTKPLPESSLNSHQGSLSHSRTCS